MRRVELNWSPDGHARYLIDGIGGRRPISPRNGRVPLPTSFLFEVDDFERQTVGAPSENTGYPSAPRFMDPAPTPRDDALLQELLRELRQKAQSLLSGERRSHTLQPTALVHEAWLRIRELADLPMGEDPNSQRQFVALAVRAMRNVLIDHARQRQAQKRGGERSRVALDDTTPMLAADPSTLLDLEEALSRLHQISERLALVAELRLLGGLSMPEIAAVAEVSLTTAKEEWTFAQALLARWLDDR